VTIALGGLASARAVSIEGKSVVQDSGPILEKSALSGLFCYGTVLQGWHVRPGSGTAARDRIKEVAASCGTGQQSDARRRLWPSSMD
jgi:hypothetical protein